MTHQETLERLRKAREPKQKKIYNGIAKKSPKKIAQEAAEKEERGGNDTELKKWFQQRIKNSSGYCSECNCKVEKNIFQYAVMTVCHLLPKRYSMCPSVKTHPQNFIILCPDCHSIFDNATWEEKEMMGCWPVVAARLALVYPNIAENERRHFPANVLPF